jgi:hypothetical protein
MAQKERKSTAILKASALGLWLLTGPYLCLLLLSSFLPDFSTANPWLFWPAWVSSGIAALGLYFLPLPLWQRICVFAVYVPIVGMILPLVAVVMACVLFHDCL